MQKFGMILTLFCLILAMSIPAMAGMTEGVKCKLSKKLIKGEKYHIYLKVESDYYRGDYTVKVTNDNNKTVAKVKETSKPGVTTVHLSWPVVGRVNKYHLTVYFDGDDRALYQKTISCHMIPVLTFKKSSRSKINGVPAQRFTFTQKYCMGKKLYVEIYDKNGKLCSHKGAFTESTTDNGKFNFYWKYFPDNGPKCKTGTYHIKYWPEGGEYKQVDLHINI